MSVVPIVEKLLGLALSREAKVLTDPSRAEFQELLARWTDVDKKQPHAVVMPSTEDDAVKIIKWAVTAGVPFVAKAGGHSAWSTIGEEGFILDFSLMRGVEADTEKQRATASAGSLVGDVVKAAAAKGFCVATGTVNSVGFIPSTIGGGLTVLAPLIGYGSDNIISARMITAMGELITVSETSHPNLLYAIKGAGQFFGAITSLTVKLHPLDILGSPDGIIWSSTFIFSTSRAAEVAKASLDIKKHAPRSYCLAGVMPTPPKMDPVIMVIAAYLGPKADGELALKPLLDLGPDAIPASAEVPFREMNDAFAAFEAKGGYKSWLAPGLTSVEQFPPEDMVYFVEQQARLGTEYPGAKPTAFVIEFTSHGEFDQVALEKETAFAHRDVAMFVHLLCWGSDAESLDGAVKIAEEVVAHIRRNQPKDQYSFYQNFSRTAPIGERYKDSGRLERLRSLKQEWDSKGIFTMQLL